MLPHTHRTFELRQGLLVDTLVLALAQVRAVVRLLLLLLMLLRLFRRRAFVGVVATSATGRLVPVRGAVPIAVVMVFLGLTLHRCRSVAVALNRGPAATVTVVK